MPALTVAGELRTGVVMFDNLSNGMQALMAFLIVVSIIYLVLVFMYLAKPNVSGMLGSTSDPRRGIFGNQNQLLTVSGPVVHQDDYDRHKDMIAKERIPMGVTSPSIGFTRGASSALRTYRDGGDNGPQDTLY